MDPDQKLWRGRNRHKQKYINHIAYNILRLFVSLKKYYLFSLHCSSKTIAIFHVFIKLVNKSNSNRNRIVKKSNHIMIEIKYIRLYFKKKQANKSQHKQ